jgi:hypothetical protein
MKFLWVLLAALSVGCNRSKTPLAETFTILEHIAATDNASEGYIIRHDVRGTSIMIKTYCGFTQYDNKSTNRGFCPSERLPTLGQPISRCTEKSETGAGSPPCVYRAGDHLAFHEGGSWGNDEINLAVDSEVEK